ncbi:MAG: tetratricopeptide repeat protein [Pseudomonadota bacterium]
MSDLTEEEQVERMRVWWGQYGLVTIVALVAFAAGFIGVTQWKAGKQAHSEAASLLFDDAVEAADASDITLLVQSRNRLVADYNDTPYASQAGLRLAALYVQRGETDEAQRVLTEVLANEKGQLLEPVVATRLARVQIYREDAEAALQTLDGISEGVYGPVISSVRGDALAALGRVDDAAAAYAAAIADEDSQQLVDPVIVNMKIAALSTTFSEPLPEPAAVEPTADTQDDGDSAP